MENVSIAIVSAERSYRKALCMSLLNACRNFVIETFDSRDFVMAWSEYKGKGLYYEQFDLVLWSGDEISEAYGGNIIYLTDKPSMCIKDFKSKRFCIYMYSNAQSMVAAIFDIYSFLTGRSAVCLHAGNVRLFGFASCAGGTGCSTVAMAVAQELCRFRGMKVLYLTMEEVESTGEFAMPRNGAKAIGEYLYRLLRPNGRIVLKRDPNDDRMPFIDGYIVKSIFGVEAFAPTTGRNPLRYISDREMQQFLSAVVDCGRYNAVIIDLGSCLSEAGIAAMQMAEKIAFVARYGDTEHREIQYLTHVMCSAGDIVLDRMIRTVNLIDNDNYSIENCGSMLDTKSDAGIRMFENDTSAQIRGQTGLEGGFGEDIRRLSERMLRLDP